MRQRYDGDVPLDEQSQEDIITELVVEMQAKKRLYCKLFVVLMLLPTPVFIFSRQMRAHSALALQALLSVVVSAYNLYYEKTQVTALNIVLACLVTIQAVLRLRPLSGQDVLWFVPMVSVLTCFILQTWFNDMHEAIEDLKTRKFKVR